MLAFFVAFPSGASVTKSQSAPWNDFRAHIAFPLEPGLRQRLSFLFHFLLCYNRLYVYCFRCDGGNNNYFVRPVVSLKGKIKVVDGIGTKEKPYIIRLI